MSGSAGTGTQFSREGDQGVADDVPRILVVDDEPDVRELVEVLLAAPARLIDGADGGREALRRLAAQAYDLVVSDLRMPEVDGIQIYQAVQAQPAPRPALLFMSGFTNAAEFVRTCGALRHWERDVQP